MATVPSNLIPTRITQLPDAPSASENTLLIGVFNGVTYKIRAGDLLQVAGVPISRQVIAGTGLVGGGALSSNVTLSVAPGGIGPTQLAATGVTPGVYGDGANIPQLTVDATGRVTAASLVPFSVSGFVPVGREVIAGEGLQGGGALTSNVTLSVSYTNAPPLSGSGSGSAGFASTAARSDHRHPAVDLSSDNEVDGLLGIGNGGTGRSLVMNAGAVVWSGADGLYVGPAGVAGQVLVSGGNAAPTWGSTLILAPVAAHRFFGGPTFGSDADPVFRALVNADLPNSGVVANTYGSATLVPALVVNSKGVVTGATQVPVTPAWANVTGTPTTIAGYGITDGVTLTGAQTLTNKTIDASLNTLSNIPNAALSFSGITINGQAVQLGGSVTVTATASNTLTIGAGLSGGSYNGSAPVTIANTGVLSFSGGSTGLTPAAGTNGDVVLGGVLALGSGGTGATSAAGARSSLGLGTLALQNANAVAITGGAIDGAVIGATNAAAITGTVVTASSRFASANYDALNSAGGSLRTASGAPCLQWGGGGGVNLTLDGPFNMNPANASISLAPTGTGTVTVAPATAGSINNMVIGAATPQAITGTTVTATTQFSGPGTGLSGTAAALSIGGNAATATALQTARTINGSSFDGTANITTATWGTARLITIGGTGKSVNGGAAVAWSLAEIGAPAVDGTGAVGTWGINISGNAATATSASTAGSATTAGSASNIAGGASGQIPYQTAAGATAFIANGTAGQVLTSAGAGTPVWSGISGGTF